ncbi:hypothetical protein [Chroococcidiopsis sp [FACHB-1243]]|nr:hypothetical protein [Chroococcidiopsis sp. [FACHB-1243]]
MFLQLQIVTFFGNVSIAVVNSPAERAIEAKSLLRQIDNNLK